MVSVQLVANAAQRTVKVTQLGANSCVVNGSSLAKGEYVVAHCKNKAASLYFTESKYPYSIQFKDDDEKSREKEKDISDFFKPKSKKRKSENPENYVEVKKMKLAETDSKPGEGELSESDDDEDRKRIEQQLRMMKEEFNRTAASALNGVPKVNALVYRRLLGIDNSDCCGVVPCSKLARSISVSDTAPRL